MKQMQNFFGNQSMAVGAGLLLAFLATPVMGVEQEVRNDTLNPPATGAILGDFAVGELASVLLTSPCDGSIKAVQFLWQSQAGTATDTLENNIWVYDSGVPSGATKAPGPVLLQLQGPVLSPGVLNEFRFVDEANSIPINVPVTNGQTFIVALEFGNDTSIATGTASVVHDANGCQSGLNFLYSGTWRDFCPMGVSGDLVIRAVVDCPGPSGACCDGNAICTSNVQGVDCAGANDTFFQDQTCLQVTCPEPVGACCNGGGGCLEDQTQNFCENILGSTYGGNNTMCADQVCDLGACCMGDGTCQDLIDMDCIAAGGTFQGPGTDCATTACPQPTGACCLGTTCVENQTETNCNSFAGTWQGSASVCSPDPCNACNDGDADQDGDIDLGDFASLQNCWGAPVAVGCECLDMDNDNDVDLTDLAAFDIALDGASGGP